MTKKQPTKTAVGPRKGWGYVIIAQVPGLLVGALAALVGISIGAMLWGVLVG